MPVESRVIVGRVAHGDLVDEQQANRDEVHRVHGREARSDEPKFRPRRRSHVRGQAEASECKEGGHVDAHEAGLPKGAPCLVVTDPVHVCAVRWRLQADVIEDDLTGENEAHTLDGAAHRWRTPLRWRGQLLLEVVRHDVELLGKAITDRLVGLRLWQLLPLDGLRHRRPLVWREATRAARDAQLLEQQPLIRGDLRWRRRLEDDDAAHLLAPRRRWHRKDHRHAHPRQRLLDRVFELVGRDLLASSFDELLGAPLYGEVAVGVEQSDIAREEEAVGVGIGGAVCA
mmetsp:Transcript_19008/g.61214  ORF Transcript_19008/g.61214 Transcript_19008/m.61214 type:complete len:286 (+) Transcript_19008:1516-2373(+)